MGGHRIPEGVEPVGVRIVALAAEAAILSVVVRVSLRLAGTGATLRRADRFVAAAAIHRDNDVEHRQLREIPRAVRAVGSRRPLRFTCLPRSIVTWAMLRRRGIPVDLRIGVGGSSREFASHAWVEIAGLPIGEELDDVRAFRPLPADGILALGRKRA